MGMLICLIALGIFTLVFFIINLFAVRTSLDSMITSYETITCSVIYPIDEIVEGVELGEGSTFKGLMNLKDPINGIKGVVKKMEDVNADMSSVPANVKTANVQFKLDNKAISDWIALPNKVDYHGVGGGDCDKVPGPSSPPYQSNWKIAVEIKTGLGYKKLSDGIDNIADTMQAVVDKSSDFGNSISSINRELDKAKLEIANQISELRS